jgi:ubiquinone/menaquinone biosynthesis C-methylase UbiE
MLRLLGSILRPALVLSTIFLFLGLAVLTYQGVRTLQTLTAVEADRDRWQRPEDVIRPLKLHDESVVVDFGSGSGYFALKLADNVGLRGEVMAVDLRRLSLFFLRVRAFLRGKHNIRIVVGDPDDPHLAANSADSVLISNTYHELSDPQVILQRISRALRSGGRLVIVDRKPVSSEKVEAELRGEGFEIVGRDDSFIQQPDNLWWLIVAAKP